jgi:hypothetical protein
MSIQASQSVHYIYKYLYAVIVLFIVLYLLYKAVTSFSGSLFVSDTNRINILIYGEESIFYSLDKKDTRHYVMYFAPDLKMQVPGGYGNYRVGSLGKLVNLEKKPDIFTKTFSIATTSFVNYYFYPGGEDVFYGKDIPEEKKSAKITDILFSKSNAGFFDRLYIAFFFISKNTDDFNRIEYSERVNAIQNDVYFQDESFVKESIGLLYQTLYRDEQKSIQILYNEDYDVAHNIGNLLEGNGIRVNDLSLDINRVKTCSVIESGKEHSNTAQDLASFFHCELKAGSTDVYDIIFVLGNIEKEWE